MAREGWKREARGPWTVRKEYLVSLSWRESKKVSFQMSIRHFRSWLGVRRHSVLAARREKCAGEYVPVQSAEPALCESHCCQG